MVFYISTSSEAVGAGCGTLRMPNKRFTLSPTYVYFLFTQIASECFLLKGMYESQEVTNVKKKHF
jgi:hypothetical protein